MSTPVWFPVSYSYKKEEHSMTLRKVLMFPAVLTSVCHLYNTPLFLFFIPSYFSRSISYISFRFRTGTDHSDKSFLSLSRYVPQFHPA